MQMPKFSASPHNFHTDLKKRINSYFDQVGKSTTGNFSLYLKAAVLAISFVGLYIHLVFFTLLFFCNTGMFPARMCHFAIGFNVMHDGGTAVSVKVNS
jgi:linoleoyl-CoA desaturase